MAYYFRLMLNWFWVEVWAIPWRMIIFAFLVFLSIVPIISSNPYILKVLVFAFIFSISFVQNLCVLNIYTERPELMQFPVRLTCTAVT